MADFLGRIEGDRKEMKSDQKYLRYYVNRENGDDFYIGKTTDLKNMIQCKCSSVRRKLGEQRPF